MGEIVELSGDIRTVVEQVESGEVFFAIRITVIDGAFELVERFAAYLAQDTSLLQLSFYECPVEANTLEVFVDAIVSNPKTSLRSLNLGNSRLTDAAAPFLAKLFRYNTSLVEINLIMNQFGQGGLDQMEAALSKYNFYIEEIYSHRIGNTSNLNWKIYQPVSRNKRNNQLKRTFAKKLDNSKLCRWGRAKLMVIGQGGAGKTSTVRCLLGQQFVSEHDSTIGASLNQTDTKNWQEKDAKESDFNETAARALKEQLDRFDAENREKEMGVKQWKPSRRGEKESAKRAKTKRGTRGTRLGRVLGGGKKAKEPVKEKKAKEDVEKRTAAQPRHIVTDGEGEEEFAIDREPERAAVFKPVQNKALLNEMDVARRFREKLLSRAMEDVDDEDDENKLTFTIWDYGGQTVFYTFHHLFLTKYGVYLIVFDLSTLLDGSDLTVPIEFLKFWIQSVMLHAPNAPCILIGTHLDEIMNTHKDKKSLESFLNRVGDILEEDVGVLRHTRLMKTSGRVFLPLDNRSGKNIDMLRNLIDKAARDEYYVNQEIPLRWVLTLDLLVNEEEAEIEGGKNWVSLTEVETVAEKFGLSKPEVAEMLKLFHQLGVLIFLSATEALRNVVVINPQWLIDKLGKVIRDDMHGMPDEIKRNTEAAEEWNRLRLTGAASRDLFDDVWNEKKLPANALGSGMDALFAFNAKQTDFLIDLMKQTMLLSDWYWKTDSARGEHLFLVPSIVRTTKEDVNKVNEALRTWPKTCMSLYLDFSDFFLPTGVFQRLVCLFVSIIANQIKEAPEPILGEDFALLFFTGGANTKFKTQLYLTKAEPDRIMLSVKDQSQARDMLNMVQVLVRKLRSEVMGSRLKMKLVLTLHQPLEAVQGDELKQKELIQETTDRLFPISIGPLMNKSNFTEKEYFKAKEDSAYGLWFQEVKKVATFVDIDNFFS